MNPVQLAAALHLDEDAPDRARLLVASLALSADLQMPPDYIAGAIDFQISRAAKAPEVAA